MKTYFVGVVYLLWIVLLLQSSVTKGGVNTSCLGYNDIPNHSPDPDPTSPDFYTIRFDTDLNINGVPAPPFFLNITRSWAPLGSDRLYQLILDNYYTNATFFRVVPSFVVQWGIASNPAESAKWDTPISDDPVTQCNTVWTVSYATAGEDTRTTQLFINYIDNSRLDNYGFAPIGIITSGFATVLDIVNPTPNTSDGINQTAIYMYGNEYVYTYYPNTTMITCASISYSSNASWGGGESATTCYAVDDESKDVGGESGDVTTTFVIAVMASLVFVMILTIAATKKTICDRVLNSDKKKSLASDEFT